MNRVLAVALDFPRPKSLNVLEEGRLESSGTSRNYERLCTMARQVELIHRSESAIFTLTKITRSNLYGSKKRIPVDHQGRACTRAMLTRDGQFVLPAGSTASVYMDEARNSVERSEIQAVTGDGTLLDTCASSFESASELGEPVAPMVILEQTISHVYAIDPITIPQELNASLTEGAIYRFSFQFKAGHFEYDAFLLKNQVGFFLLVGRSNFFELVGMEDADDSLPDFEGEDFDDDLDFAMV